MQARVAAGGRLDQQGAVRSEAYGGQRALRHPVAECGAGQRGEQLGGGGPDVLAAVAERGLQERLVGRAQSLLQGVQEEQPVLGPLGRPGPGEQREPGGRIPAAQPGQLGDPFGEQPLLPDAVRAGRPVHARGAHQIAPVRVLLGQPAAERADQHDHVTAQLAAGPGGLQQGRHLGGGRAVAALAGGGQPLREQLGEVGQGAAASSSG